MTFNPDNSSVWLRDGVRIALRKVLKAILLLTIGLLWNFSGLHGPVMAADVFYSIQLSSFHNEENAQATVDGLIQSGHRAFFRKEGEAGAEVVYRVYIEQFPSKEQAEKEAASLRELDLIADYTIKTLQKEPSTPPVASTKGTRNYYIQVSANKEHIHAEKTVTLLTEVGYHAFYRSETIASNDLWHKVYVGPFDSLTAAKKAGQELTNRKLVSGYIVKKLATKAPSRSSTPRGQGKRITLHVSSMKDKNNAEKLAQRLTTAGRQSSVIAEESEGELWYRVYVGEFQTEEDARAFGVTLQHEGIIPYFKPVEIKKPDSTD